jgi:hypothetical protein
VRKEKDSNNKTARPHRTVINMTTMKMKTKTKRKPEPVSDISGTFNRVAADLELYASVWYPRVKPQWRTRDGKPVATPVINMTATKRRKIAASFNQHMAAGKVGAAMKIAAEHPVICFTPVQQLEARPHEKDLPPPPVRKATTLKRRVVDEEPLVPELNPVQRAAAVAEGVAANVARRKAKELMAAGKIEQWMKFVSRNPISLS